MGSMRELSVCNSKHIHEKIMDLQGNSSPTVTIGGCNAMGCEVPLGGGIIPEKEVGGWQKAIAKTTLAPDDKLC